MESFSSVDDRNVKKKKKNFGDGFLFVFEQG